MLTNHGYWIHLIVEGGELVEVKAVAVVTECDREQVVVLLRRLGVIVGFMLGFAYLALVTAEEAGADTGGLRGDTVQSEAEADRGGLLGGVLEPVGAVASPVLEPVGEAVAPVVEPVAEVAGPVVAPVVRAVEPVVEPVLEPVATAVEPLVATVAPVLEPVTAPILDAAEPVTEPIADAGAERVISRIDGDVPSSGIDGDGPSSRIDGDVPSSRIGGETPAQRNEPQPDVLPEPGVALVVSDQVNSSPASARTSGDVIIRQGGTGVPPPGPSGPAPGIVGVSTTSTAASGGAHHGDNAVSSDSPDIGYRPVLGRAPPDVGTPSQRSGFDDRNHPS